MSWPELGGDWMSWEAGPPALWDPLKVVGTRHLPSAPPDLLRSQELFPSPQGMQGQGQRTIGMLGLPEAWLAQCMMGQVIQP